MADVFEVLGKDHAEVRAMLTELEAGTRKGPPADPAELRRRGELVQRLVIDESKHEAVEEEYFWPAVRELLGDGDELADHGVGQEQDAKHVLAVLDKSKPGEADFEEAVARFIADAREHISYEEGTVWPRMRQVLDPERAQRMGDRIAAAKKHAPTRPHPNTPPNPALLKTAGPAVAATDRIRDLVSGRGRH
ncbi:hemerythrin domain-containing protein [Actinomadura atramentaria]|uniref:hemerythrin domain-containing protein n=1 Tax=Actinomadura atramentaria TaxID=1990 RepID=UPI00037A4BAD|nr:hemerythrin domain-containing protein [Actinomadura atramentaria]